MTTHKPKPPDPFVVRCPEYTKTFKTRADAEKFVESVNKMGACPYPHEVEESNGMTLKLCRYCAGEGIAEDGESCLRCYGEGTESPRRRFTSPSTPIKPKATVSTIGG